MAKIKVFAVTVQNHPGALAAIAKALGSAKVNILGLMGSTQGEAGTLCLVVDETKRARKVLTAANVAFTETTAECCELPNKPGALAEHLEKLAAKGVNLSSITATAVKGGKKAVVIYTVQAPAKAAEPPAAAPAT